MGSMRKISWLVPRLALVSALPLVIGGGATAATPQSEPPEHPVPVAQPGPNGLADLAVVPAIKACEDLLREDFTDVDGAPSRLHSATVVTEGTPQPYCDVKGYAAGAVNFEVKLPVSGWTQRFLMLGCGGYCGAINVTPAAASTTGCAPLESGEMVVASTDLGHTRSASFFADGLWALGNPDAVADFAYLGMRKTTLIAKALIRSFYHQSARYNYFVGCSDG